MEESQKSLEETLLEVRMQLAEAEAQLAKHKRGIEISNCIVDNYGEFKEFLEDRNNSDH